MLYRPVDHQQYTVVFEGTMSEQPVIQNTVFIIRKFLRGNITIIGELEDPYNSRYITRMRLKKHRRVTSRHNRTPSLSNDNVNPECIQTHI